MAYARPDRSLPSAVSGAPGAPQRSVVDSPLAQTLFYAILFTIPYFRFRDLPGPFFMKVDYLLTATLLLVTVPVLIANKQLPDRLKANIWRPIGLFLLVNVASTLLSPYPNQALLGLVLLGAIVIFFTINLMMINDRGVETYLPFVLGISGGINAVLACFGYFLGVDYFVHESGRGIGGTIGANNMALMSVFAIPIMVYWAVMGETPLRRLLGIGITLALMGALVATESRGGFLNLVAVLGLLLLQFRHHFHPRYLGVLVGGSAAAVIAVMTLVPQDYIERQASLRLLVEWVTGDSGELSQDFALDRRAAYLAVALDAFPQRPILGSGPDTFPKIWVESMETRWFDMEERPAHNTYIEVVIGTGLVGLGIFLFLLAMTYNNYRHAERMLRQAGDERGAHLIGAYKIAYLAVLVYFFFKSGIDHKYFILALPISVAALRYARNRIAGGPETDDRVHRAAHP